MNVWDDLSSRVLERPAHEAVWVHRSDVPHPSECGFYRSHGLDRRARAHFRRPLSDRKGLHVLEFPNHYRLHWDRVDPMVSLWGHFVRDVVTTLVWRPRSEPDSSPLEADPLESG